MTRPAAVADARWCLIALGLILFGSALAGEQRSTCPTKLYRWEEDCRNLEGQKLSGLEALRLISLGPHATLTLGGEARVNWDHLDPPEFGLQHLRGFDAIGDRVLLSADLRTRWGPRVFMQAISGHESGRLPFERPFDRDRLDLAQGFLELPTVLAGTPILLRAGRQELDLQGNRLVAVRDIANVRLAFDAVLLEARPARFLVDVFGGRPVLVRPGVFDDHGDPHERFYGVTLEHPVFSGSGAKLAAGLFAFRHALDHALYFEGSAPERRDTYGARMHGAIGNLDVAVQAAVQRGTFGHSDIEASGVAIDIGWRIADVPGRPRLGVSGGRASGDTRRGDGQLGTFDPLYPNLSYFTDAPLVYPRNIEDLEPNLTLMPAATLSVQTGVDLLWRVSKNDALYAPPGIPLIPGTGQGPNNSFAEALYYARSTWSPNPHWQFQLSYVAGIPGDLVRQAGGRRVNFVRTVITTKF